MSPWDMGLSALLPVNILQHVQRKENALKNENARLVTAWTTTHSGYLGGPWLDTSSSLTLEP